MAEEPPQQQHLVYSSSSSSPPSLPPSLLPTPQLQQLAVSKLTWHWPPFPPLQRVSKAEWESVVSSRQRSDGILRLKGLPTRATAKDVLAFFQVGGWVGGGGNSDGSRFQPSPKLQQRACLRRGQLKGGLPEPACHPS